MALKKTIKSLVEHVPYPIGKIMARVPFSLRLGTGYGEFRHLVLQSREWSTEQQEEYAIQHFSAVFEHAKTFPCYRELYEKSGVLDLHVASMADVRKVPTVDKQWTRQHFGEFKGAYRLNTGGSSGEPTAFWMDKNCWAREWAHMHAIWEKLGYRYTDLKLAIRGKNLGRRPFAYNPVHNEYIINTYLPVKDYAGQLQDLFRKRRPKWFHGYPSSIYQFILECETVFGVEGTRKLFEGVSGLLLSSEYPHPYLVRKFEECRLKWISWYGHSEMAVLAWADAQMVYHPFVTYGLAEVVGGHLLGTGYHNFDMPLIRYDTGDLVEEVADGFKVKEGRSGDFVVDKNGKRIPLTALIFGRHHRAFDLADHVQIRQLEDGKATLIVSGALEHLSTMPMSELFDLTHVAIDFDLEVVKQPIRTAAGKLKLKV